MTRNFLSLMLLFAVTLFSSCTNEDDPIVYTNGFTYNEEFYPLNHLYLTDENGDAGTPGDISIVMSNANLLLEDTPSYGVNFVYFDVPADNLQPVTYQEIPDYSVFTNSEFVSGELTPGTTLFDDSSAGKQAASVSLTIQSITETEILASFNLLRTDGAVLTGSYSGPYTVIE